MTKAPVSDVRAALARLPHFARLDEELLARVAACARPRNLRAEELVFRAGEKCLGFHVVVQGGVRLFRSGPDGREHVVHRVRAGQSFAEAALFGIGRYPVSAAASATPTAVLLVAGEPFLRLFHAEARLSEAMVASLCQRLLSLVSRVEQLALPGAAARLAHHLLHLPARNEGGRVVVELEATQRELARLLAMRPETLSRLLRRLADQGVLERRGRKVVIRDSAALDALLSEPESAPD